MIFCKNNKPPQETSDTADGIRAGTWDYLRVQIALFCSGFATFSMLYGAQPLFPLFVSAFDISPARASLSLSAATGMMALMLIPMSLISDRYGRRGILLTSLVAASVLMLLCAATHSFSQLVVLRALQGVSLAAPAAIAMTYLAEEVDMGALGSAMGFYIAGNGFGGMSGRFFSAWVAQHASWVTAIIALGIVGLSLSLVCWYLLPRSRRFSPRAIKISVIWDGVLGHFKDPIKPYLFYIGFVLQGCLVSLYSYIPFRLLKEPYSLTTGQIGFFYLLYIFGVFSSAIAGRIADRYGLSRVFWMLVALMLSGVLLTLAAPLPLVILGVAVATVGFFGAHAIASSWVGQRAKQARALASALYLFLYYLGLSIIGTFSGTLWAFGGWTAIVAWLSSMLFACFVVAVWLKKRQEAEKPS
jgi:YNFM family putative membrane transporter